MEKSKTWSWIVLWVTLFYLVVETSFSSELLNIVGQNASTADITAIEHWGRCISGFAVGLIFWSVLTPDRSIFGVRPFKKVSRALLVNIVVTFFTMIFVYHWEMQIVHTAKSDNSGTKRKEAVYAAFVRTGLLNHTVQLTGMDSKNVNYNTPEGKSFIALLPLLADSDGGLSSKVHGVLKNVLEENTIVQEQGAQGFYNKIFIPSARYMDKAWAHYQSMVNHLNSAYEKANAAPSFEQNAIIAKANNQFNTTFRKAFSIHGYPPATVNPSTVHNAHEFFDLPAIRRFWKHHLHLSGRIPPMMPNESYTQVKSAVWPVFLNDAANKALKTFQSNAKDFRNGGIYAQKGKNAVVLLTVPAMALIFSVIGMLIHSTKVIYYLQKVSHKKKDDSENPYSLFFWRAFIALAMSGGAACFFYFWSNDMTQSTLYHHLIMEYQKNGHDMWPDWMITWIIQAEQFVYPVADFLREHVLMGCHFGVSS